MEDKTCTRPGPWKFMPGLLVGVIVGSFAVAFILPIATAWLEQPREARSHVKSTMKVAEVASDDGMGR
jgi:hypothetical protein